MKNKMKIRFRKKITTYRILKWNFLTRQFLKQNFQNVSYFGLEVIQRVRFCGEKKQRVRFWNESFSRCQNLKKCLYSKNPVWFIWLLANHRFSTFRGFLKSIILNGRLYFVTDSELEKNYNAPDFEFKIVQTRQIFKKNCFWRKQYF